MRRRSFLTCTAAWATRAWSRETAAHDHCVSRCAPNANAVRMDHDGILKLWGELKGSMYWYSPLLMAARQGYTTTLKALHKSGCDVTASWEGGTTALHIAAQHGKLDACRYLLKRGCNLSTQMQSGYPQGKGKTALQLARDEEGFMEVAELLTTWKPSATPASDTDDADDDDDDDDAHIDEDDDDGKGKWITSP